MDAIDIIEYYYTAGTPLYQILISHGQEVAQEALSVAARHPELHLDEEFLYQASLLHDIGIIRTDAPSIYCFGSLPYIAHGYIGKEMLSFLGYPNHGLVAERHTGVGISLAEIIKKDLPLPHRDLLPLSVEEQVICFADKFYSKTGLGKKKPIECIVASLSTFDPAHGIQFQRWCDAFL